MAFSDTVQAPIWTALADPKRRKIIALLQERPHTTGELCAHFDVSRFAVMKHLTVLEKVGLISVQREGRQRWNILNADAALLARELLTQPFLQARPIELFAGHVRLELMLPAPPTAVFDAFAAHIDHWWPERTAAGSRIELEAWINGRFYERYDSDRSGVLLATVIAIDPPHMLCLQGPMGISDRVALSRVELAFEPRSDATLLQLVHHVAGEVDDALLQEHGDIWRARLDCDLRRFVAGAKAGSH